MRDRKEKWKEMLRLLRPHQWIKNGVVFLAIIFGGRLLDVTCWLSTLFAGLSFCFASSAVYCLNDVIDCKYDMEDPIKCNRPVASGMVKKSEAFFLGAVAAIVSLIIPIFTLSWSCTAIIVVYLVMNVLYCLMLKNIVLIDVMIVALGFVLRVVIGGLASEIWLSQWIIIMVFLLALFLALAKRRHEVVLVSRSEKEEGRRSVVGYTVHFLNSALSMLGSVLIIGYIMYTLQPKDGRGPESEYLYITALPVLFGILRYLQLTIVENRSGSPTKIAYSDFPLIVTCIVWLLSFIIIIYL